MEGRRQVICGWMQVHMQNAETLNPGQISEFLKFGRAIEFTGQNRAETYAWVQDLLVAQEYARQGKKAHGVIRAYVGKVTGLSGADGAADPDVPGDGRGAAAAVPATRVHSQVHRCGHRAAGGSGPYPRTAERAGHALHSESRVPAVWSVGQFAVLEFHRPCGFATVSWDARGKRRREYKVADYARPYEKLKSLPGTEQHLKEGISFARMDRLSVPHVLEIEPENFAGSAAVPIP